MSRIAIIPARGGSKRLPRKNIIEFRGKPIIAYSIEAGLETDLFEKVVVSTDDEQIAEISKKYGAEVSYRPANLADDRSSVVDVCVHQLSKEKDDGREYDLFACLYATAPLRTADDIVQTVQIVETGEADFAMAVTEYHFPAYQALLLSDDHYLRPVWPEWNIRKSQDVPRMIVDNGSTYIATVSNFLKERTFYGKRCKGYFMPRVKSVDIDTIDDLLIAEKFAELVDK